MKREIDIILDNVDELRSLIEAMSQEKEIPAILFRFSYEKSSKILHLLQELETLQKRIEEKEELQVVQTAPLVEPATTVEESSVILPEVTANTTIPCIESVEEEPVNQPLPETTPPNFVLTKETPKAEETESEETKPASGPSKLIAETFDSVATTERIHEKLLKKTVQDIRKAISLVDRFRYIRELFGSDSVFFEEALDLINNAESYEEIKGQLFAKYDWNPSSEEVQEFLQLVRLRFA